MQKKPSKTRGRRRNYARRPFIPSEPPIVVGKFVGRRLSELSDQELNYFLRVDARLQAKQAIVVPTSTLFTPSCPDLSQYWFAKYELERRKPDALREVGASLEIASTDSKETIGLKLAEYGYRAATRKYHPDRGGDTEIMQRLNIAREFVRNQLKGRL